MSSCKSAVNPFKNASNHCAEAKLSCPSTVTLHMNHKSYSTLLGFLFYFIVLYYISEEVSLAVIEGSPLLPRGEYYPEPVSVVS